MSQRRGSRYPKAVKEKALAIAEEETAVVAAEELGIPVATIYAWKQQKGAIGPPRGEKDPEGWAAKKEQGARESWNEAKAALQLVRQRLEAGEENKAKTAALTFAILADKSAMLEQSSALAEERKASVEKRMEEIWMGVGLGLAECLKGIFRDLGITVTPELAKVVGHHLKGLEEEQESARGLSRRPAPAAPEARAEMRAEFEPPPPMPEPKPVLELEAEAIEEVEAEEPVREPEGFEPHDDYDTGEVCPCG